MIKVTKKHIVNTKKRVILSCPRRDCWESRFSGFCTVWLGNFFLKNLRNVPPSFSE